MFVLFFGVSCVGKNELITELMRYFNWRYVPTYMTRPLRENETGKVSVTKKVFDELERNGKFICVNNIFGNFYGTPKKEILNAKADENFCWVLDFSISKRHLLEDFAQMTFIIIPESIEQLNRQIEKSGRDERRSLIIDDYSEHYSGLSNFSKTNKNIHIIVNRENEKKKTAKKINELIKSYEYFD